MKFASLFALFALVALPLPAEPPDALVGDWWGTIAERRVSFAADGTLTEFRPSDAAERKGTWSLDGAKLAITWEGRSAADAFTIALEKEELVLTEADGRSARLRKEARADREKRLTDMLVEGLRKLRDSDEEADQFKRAQMIRESRDLAEKSESLVRSLAGADRGKQQAYTTGLVKAREPGLIEEPHAPADGDTTSVQPRAAEAPGAKRNCINSLKQIGVYFALYESKFKKYPRSINDLKDPAMLTDESLLHCPADAAGEEHTFRYVVPAKGDATAPDAVMAFDPIPHKDGTRNVLLFQGRVISMAEEDFRKALAASGGTLNVGARRTKGAVARSEVKDGKVVVTIRAKIVDLKKGALDGKEQVKARVRAVASVEGESKAVESGVRVVAGEPAAEGTEIEITVTLPCSDPGKIESVTLLVEDRVAFETGETRIDGKKIKPAK